LLIDAPAGISKDGIVPLAVADEVILVVNPELSSIVDALKTKIKDIEDKSRADAITDFLSEFKAQGKLLPAQEDIYRDRLDRASDVKAEMAKMAEMFKAMPKLVDLDTVDGEDGKDKLSEGGKAEFEKTMLRRDLLATGHSGQIDAKDLDEFAEAFATNKPGERHQAMVAARNKLRNELTRK
jgi:phage I-like protein